MQTVISHLVDLGASSDQIDKIRLKMDSKVLRTLRRRVTVKLQSENKELSSLFENTSHMYLWNKTQFEEFIYTNDLKIHPEVTENLLKLEYYQDKRRLP